MNLPTDKQLRKEMPIARGVLGYFPNAIAEVARVSYHGNAQHNPGQPMHWSREKSADHTDCIVRHLIEVGSLDEDGMRHSAKLAWRALANLQLELEAAAATPIPDIKAVAENPKMIQDLIRIGCSGGVADQIYRGTMRPWRDTSVGDRVVYVVGPMRGYENFNFPAFDERRNELLAHGFTVISPADIDRAANDISGPTLPPQHVFVYRDFFALYYIARCTERGAITMLPGWELSTGATAEFRLAKWLGLEAI